MTLALCTHQEELASTMVKVENPVISSFDCGHSKELNNSWSDLTVEWQLVVIERDRSIEKEIGWNNENKIDATALSLSSHTK